MIRMILATGRNGEIGDSKRPDGLPWEINKEDMAQFKSKTQGDVVVMGGNTFRQLQDIGFKYGLPKRNNLVISDSITWDLRGRKAQVIGMEDFVRIQELDDETDFWIIGGKSIYDQCIPYVEEVHITKIDRDFPEADTYMNLNFLREFELQSLTELNDYSIVYVYKRKK